MSTYDSLGAQQEPIDNREPVAYFYDSEPIYEDEPFYEFEDEQKCATYDFIGGLKSQSKDTLVDLITDNLSESEIKEQLGVNKKVI